MTFSRRHLLALGLAGAGAAYVWHRGIRYPRLSFEPEPLTTQQHNASHHLQWSDLIATDEWSTSFRAFAPEPTLEVIRARSPLQISVNNVSPKARLLVSNKSFVDIHETVDGIKRFVNLPASNERITLAWQLNDQEPIRFAVIGDTGANQELNACLDRAVELGADYLLHLGDFNYADGEFDTAIRLFQNAPLPCFVSIGNHDFRDNGLIYEQFRRQIGPMNNAFNLFGKRFVNLDTAADFFPAGRGNRGALMRQLYNKTVPTQNQVFFSHRPLKDPRPHDDHEVGGINEVAWLSKAIQKSGGGIYLNGHVHHSAEFDFEGVRQYTIGEGLGHEDLILQRQVAQLLTIDVGKDEPLAINWQDLNLPWAAHQSPTHAYKLKRDGRSQQLEWYQSLMARAS